MLYLIDRDGVRSRVHRKMFAQAMPETVLKCATELETVCSEPLRDKVIRVVVSLEGLDASSLEQWIEEMNERHASWFWFAFLNRNESIPDWIPALCPAGILCEPLDIHVIKRELSMSAV